MAYPNYYQTIPIPTPCYQSIPIPTPCYQPIPVPIPCYQPAPQPVPEPAPCTQPAPQPVPEPVPCSQTKPKLIEIARQDVIVTPDGPIEIYRKDQLGNSVSLTSEESRQLMEKYTMQQVPQRRSRSKGNCRSRSRGDPGLYRDHILVKGDGLETYQCGRKYVNYRNPFDWYNTCRFDLIDDIEEVLEEEPYSRHMYSDRSYCPSRSRSRRSYSRSMSRPRSREMPREGEEEEVVYIIKKKNPIQKAETNKHYVEGAALQNPQVSYDFSSEEKKSSSGSSSSSSGAASSRFEVNNYIKKDKSAIISQSKTESVYSYEPVVINDHENTSTRTSQYKNRIEQINSIISDWSDKKNRTIPESELFEKFQHYLSLNK